MPSCSVAVVEPRSRHSALARGKRRDGQRLWVERRPQECHARLLRRAPALSRIARVARGDDVVPRCLSALDARDDVIVGELARSLFHAAVLAAKSSRVKTLIRENLMARFVPPSGRLRRTTAG